MTKTTAYTGPYNGTDDNSQPVEKKADHEYVDVHSIFYTIQGEGPFCGQPATFVRLAGCNLKCPKCDTEYTAERSTKTAEDIVQQVQDTLLHPGGLVVITGGEPMRQPVALTKLVKALTESGYTVQIETNGTLPVPEGIRSVCRPRFLLDNTTGGVYIVVSPKTGKVDKSIKFYAVCYKYVLTADHVDEYDGLPTSVLGLPRPPARPPMEDDKFTRPVYVQPCDDQHPGANEYHLRAAIASAQRFNYILQLQTHKLIGVE